MLDVLDVSVLWHLLSVGLHLQLCTPQKSISSLHRTPCVYLFGDASYMADNLVAL